MSLSIEKEPFEISLSNNPIVYEFKTDALYDGLFVYPYIDLLFNSMPDEGFSFAFEFVDPSTNNNVQIRMVCKDSIDDSGNQFTRLNSTPDSQWLNLILQDFQKNPVLATNYSITVEGNSIRFQSKIADEGFIPVNYSDNQSGIITPVILSIAEQPSTIKDLKVNLEVYFEADYKSNNWSLVGESSSTPDSSGIVYFDVQSIIHSACKDSYSNKPPVPNLVGGNVGFHTDLTRRFYIRYAESTEYTQGEFLNLKASLVHFGGISTEDFAKGNLFLYLQSLGKFNTWLNDDKKLLPEQPNFINWTNTTNTLLEVDYGITIYYTDGTSAAYYIMQDVIKVDKWETLTFKTGYEQLDIGNFDPTKTVLKWETYVTDAYSVKISETKTFYLDSNHYQNKNFIVFLNSLNTPEVIHTVGSWKKSISVNRQFVTKALKPDYEVINGQTFQYDNNSRNVYTVRTGYLSKEEVEVLQDLLIGTTTFLLDKNNYIPITIDGNSFDIIEDLTFVNALEFVVKKSFSLKQYSNVDYQPTLDTIYDCGVTGFKLNHNNLIISNVQALKLLDSEQNLISSAAYNSTSESFEFINKLTIQGNYYLVFIATVEGEVVNYNIPFEYKNKVFSYETTQQSYTSVNLVSSTPTPIYVDWGDGSAKETFTITSSSVQVAHNYTETGTKKITIETPCDQLFTQFLNLMDNSVSNLAISNLVNMEVLFVSSTALIGELNIQTLKNLIWVSLSNSNLSNLNIGFHRNITQIELNNNNLGVKQIEDLLYNLWKYRTAYANSAINLNIANNPGAGGNLSSRALDIISGTSTTDYVYLNEGLVSNYNWSITT